MYKKLKFNPKDLLIGFLILIPVIIVAIYSYNPSERAAIAEDKAKRSVVSSLANAALVYKTAYGVLPESSNQMQESGVIDWSADPNQYFFKLSEDKTKLIIYAEARSLAVREYCSGEVTNILYSTSGDKLDYVCGEEIDINNLNFVN